MLTFGVCMTINALSFVFDLIFGSDWTNEACMYNPFNCVVYELATQFGRKVKTPEEAIYYPFETAAEYLANSHCVEGIPAFDDCAHKPDRLRQTLDRFLAAVGFLLLGVACYLSDLAHRLSLHLLSNSIGAVGGRFEVGFS